MYFIAAGRRASRPPPTGSHHTSSYTCILIVCVCVCVYGDPVWCVIRRAKPQGWLGQECLGHYIYTWAWCWRGTVPGVMSTLLLSTSLPGPVGHGAVLAPLADTMKATSATAACRQRCIRVYASVKEVCIPPIAVCSCARARARASCLGRGWAVSGSHLPHTTSLHCSLVCPPTTRLPLFHLVACLQHP